MVDDVHELGPEALRRLELLMLRAPLGLRFVLATRHDVRLGLHRVRLEGELAEKATWPMAATTSRQETGASGGPPVTSRRRRS